MSQVVIASVNPVKVQATREGFDALFPDRSFTFTGVAAASGVGDQPFGDAETLTGARNRTESARALLASADYYVGIEGGVDWLGTELLAFAWVVVVSGDGRRVGKARSGAFVLPGEVAELVRGGMELGAADDVVFSRHNSRQKTGSVGILTGDVLTRVGFYAPAVILALIPFKNPGLTFAPS